MCCARSYWGIAPVLAGLLTLQGCETDGETASDAGNTETILDVELTGSVGDGPIIDAQLTVFAKTGEILVVSVSDRSAGYNIQVKTKGKYYPLVIEARGGVDLVTNLPPTFMLSSAARERPTVSGFTRGNAGAMVASGGAHPTSSTATAIVFLIVPAGLFRGPCRSGPIA